LRIGQPIHTYGTASVAAGVFIGGEPIGPVMLDPFEEAIARARRNGSTSSASSISPSDSIPEGFAASLRSGFDTCAQEVVVTDIGQLTPLDRLRQDPN
jgi:hypothetical protein